MQTEKLFIRDEVYPSWYVNALGRYLSLGAFGFVISKLSDTTIQVVAGADDQAAVVAVAGRWRWVESSVNRVHPGGAAGTYDIYVTALDTTIVSSPDPYTDTTNYGWALAIVAAGATPTIVAGSVEIFRKVGSLQWNGTKITRIDQSVPPSPLHAHRHATGQPDAITPADIGAAAAADLTSEVSRAQNAEATETAARVASVAAEASVRAAAITAEAAARQAGDRFRVVHVANLDSESSPPQSAGAVVGLVPVALLGGEGWTLVGVITRAIVAPSGTASQYKVQTDHGSGTGVLADAPGLSGVAPIQPAVGRAVRQAVTGGPMVLSDLDSVALILTTPGTTKGIAVALEFERTHS